MLLGHLTEILLYFIHSFNLKMIVSRMTMHDKLEIYAVNLSCLWETHQIDLKNFSGR